MHSAVLACLEKCTMHFDTSRNVCCTGFIHLEKCFVLFCNIRRSVLYNLCNIWESVLYSFDMSEKVHSTVLICPERQCTVWIQLESAAYSLKISDFHETHK